MIDPKDRVYQISPGVRIKSSPEGMDRATLIETIEDLADYASTLQVQIRALRSVLQHAINPKKED